MFVRVVDRRRVRTRDRQSSHAPSFPPLACRPHRWPTVSLVRKADVGNKVKDALVSLLSRTCASSSSLFHSLVFIFLAK